MWSKFFKLFYKFLVPRRERWCWAYEWHIVAWLSLVGGHAKVNWSCYIITAQMNVVIFRQIEYFLLGRDRHFWTLLDTNFNWIYVVAGDRQNIVIIYVPATRAECACSLITIRWYLERRCYRENNYKEYGSLESVQIHSRENSVIDVVIVLVTDVSPAVNTPQ